MALSSAPLAAGPIDASRWTHHRPAIRPDVSPLDAGGETGIKLHYVSCHPPSGVETKGTILLIHGFPQTWYQFRRVITPLSDAGYHIIVPDYRGAGDSTKPSQYEAVFTKAVMAGDLRILVRKVEGVQGKVHVVGHDIGGMIAHAYATQYPDETASVCYGECPIPGSSFYEKHKRDTQFWHFLFHSIPDLPELLISGKVKEYQKHFLDRHCQDPSAFTLEDREVYAQAYSGSGAMRCALNVYRAFERDAVQNKKWVEENGRCKVPCLTLWGGESWMTQEEAVKMCEEFYEDGEYAEVEGAGHWIAEEQPMRFVEAVLRWVERSG
ncbi:hypothetical protein LTR09_003987 [Extremus antarcticus]|uniref:AB hydrolase-1 domain-containing protein n=1 Tax=Extremus antarcticus TaxID=702011 RepID=A0AAJ0DQC9_9PEZI|nr:hypothetical protein LTR09_003987 [Extremus antarcticus]